MSFLVASTYLIASIILVVFGLYGLTQIKTLMRLLISLELLTSGALGILAFLAESIGLHKANEDLVAIMLAIDSTMLVLVVLLLLIMLRVFKVYDINLLSTLRR